MNEKRHVGRPTNEEVANRKKKKVIKYSLITVVMLLIVGGLFLIFNRDKIDFSSLMGNSAEKTYNYVVNSTENNGSYFIYVINDDIKEIKNCFVSKSKYFLCSKSLDGNAVNIKAKKYGTVTVKISVIKKNGKKATLKRKVRVGKDFTSPTCKITSPSKVVRRGSNVTATITCNENITMAKYNSILNGGFVMFNYNSVIEGNCDTYRWFHDYYSSIKKINNKSYQVSFKIPKDACITKDFIIYIAPGTIYDVSNNMNYTGFKTSIRIIK